MKSCYNIHEKRILILVPPLDLISGISLHYAGLQKYWTKNIRYYQTFKKINNRKIFSIIHLLWNYIYFIYTLLSFKPDTVVINVSLKKGFFSKNTYLDITKRHGKKIITFVHGWDTNSEWMLTKPKGKKILHKTDGFIVLSKQFSKKLRDIGIKQPILISSTKVDNSLLHEFNIGVRDGTIKNFLFLSRVEKSKGILISLDIFKMLQQDYSDISFYIAGSGNAIEEVKKYIADHNIQNVYLMGRINGRTVSETFAKCHCFFLLSETEGMPAALLEAMAFGIPVITRPVGGIPDFFIDGKMGIMSEQTEASYFYNRIKYLMNNASETKKICLYNYAFAKTHFYASNVAKHLEDYFNYI